MAKLNILSDVHDDFSRTHFGNWQIPDVGADIVVVAGDIAGRLSTMGRDWIEAQAHRLGKPIVIVAGDHDFGRGVRSTARSTASATASSIPASTCSTATA